MNTEVSSKGKHSIWCRNNVMRSKGIWGAKELLMKHEGEDKARKRTGTHSLKDRGVYTEIWGVQKVKDIPQGN